MSPFPRLILAIALSTVFAALLCLLLIQDGPTDRVWWQRLNLTDIAVLTLGTMVGFVSTLTYASPRGARLRVLARCLLVILSGVFGWLLAESPAVLLDHDYGKMLGVSRHTAWFHTVMAANDKDPELLHIHRPGQVFQGEVSGNLENLGIRSGRKYAVDVRYDQRGFRNHEERDRADIAVIGDSFVEGAIVPYDDTVTRRLERDLDRSAVNLGQINYTFQQELVVLKRFALPMQPKVVVWFLFGGNDLRDAVFYEGFKERLDELTWVPKLPLQERLLSTNLPRAFARILQSGKVTKRARNQRGLFNLASGRSEHVYFGYPEGPYEREAWDIGRSTLLKAQALCKEHNAYFCVVYIPRKYRVYRDLCVFEPGIVAASWKQNNFPTVLERFCRKKSIPLLDTTGPLKAVAETGRHVYYVDDVHWNSEGHRVAADLVANHLREAKLAW